MEVSTTMSTKLRIAMLVLFSLFLLRGFAQNTVSAEKIMNAIQEGESISYEGVTIVGDLDFTYMDEKMDDLPSRSRWWGSGDNEVEESIDVKISFVNCTFKGDVLAYIHHDRSGYTFTADFDRDVMFKDCTFTEDAMFKYSDFDNGADFSGSKFEGKTTFKYAEFDEQSDFSSTRFERDATFKYAQFDEGVSFRNTTFEESWNIKYLKARGDFDVRGLEVGDDIDAKYTRINGSSFTSHLVKNRN